MNARSYDPRMESLPLLISYPRSGSHWINSVLELYFNKPRLRAGPCTFLPDRNKRSDYMWFHDHDINSDLKVNHKNILYLYRNPKDVIYSLLMAEKGKIVKSDVEHQISLIKNHWKKYLVNNGAKKIVKYEFLKSTHYSEEFDNVIRFFKMRQSLDHHRLNKALLKVTKKEVEKKQIDKRYFNKEMLNSPYKRGRCKFHEQYYSLFENSFNKGKFANYYM
jgi:hypothetical protein